MTEVKGYHAVAAPLEADAPFSTFLYVRAHSSKGSDDVPAKRALFVANAPTFRGVDTAAFLREAFTPYGEVEDVSLKPATPALLEDNHRATTLAYVVFRSSKSVKGAVTASRSDVAPFRASANQDVDVQELLKRFRERHPKVKALQEEVDAYMAQFEEAEAEEERKRKETMNKVDDDGFVTVTYGKKRKRKGDTEGGKSGRSRRKKKKQYELKNFYAHQMREEKREQLAQLRKKFEEDKARIERMKAARKFKPFG